MKGGATIGAVRESAFLFATSLFTLMVPPTKGTHRGEVLNSFLAEAASEDSGHWDYALLLFYDEFLHTTMLSGLTNLSNFGWAERAALLASGPMEGAEAQGFENTSRSLGQILTSFGRNIALICIIVGMFSAPGALVGVEAIKSLLGPLSFYQG